METGRSHPLWSTRKPISPLQTVMYGFLVAALSYLAPKLEWSLILHPRTIWPLWPGCALLVPVLLLVPRRLWSILIPVALASFALYDLEAGVSLRSIAWFIPADTVQVLIAALCLTYFFDETPELNSVGVSQIPVLCGDPRAIRGSIPKRAWHWQRQLLERLGDCLFFRSAGIPHFDPGRLELDQ